MCDGIAFSCDERFSFALLHGALLLLSHGGAPSSDLAFLCAPTAPSKLPPPPGSLPRAQGSTLLDQLHSFSQSFLSLTIPPSNLLQLSVARDRPLHFLSLRFSLWSASSPPMAPPPSVPSSHPSKLFQLLPLGLLSHLVGSPSPLRLFLVSLASSPSLHRPSYAPMPSL